MKSTDEKFWDRKISIFSRKCSLKIVWKLKFFRSKIFDFFRSKIFNWNFNEKFRAKIEIFRSQKFSRPISKFSNYGSNKPFRLKFCAKLCRIQRRRPWNQCPIESRELEACAKKNLVWTKKIYFSWGLSTGRRFGNQNKPSLPYPFDARSRR